ALLRAQLALFHQPDQQLLARTVEHALNQIAQETPRDILVRPLWYITERPLVIGLAQKALVVQDANQGRDRVVCSVQPGGVEAIAHRGRRCLTVFPEDVNHLQSAFRQTFRGRSCHSPNLPATIAVPTSGFPNWHNQIWFAKYSGESHKVNASLAEPKRQLRCC